MTADYESFRSSIPYDPQRMHAAAVYCSDGRVGEQFDDFLHNGLGLPRYDRVTLPGGPAMLAGHDEARIAQESALGELQFLIEAHQLARVVLIQHQNCAFYEARLGVTGEDCEDLQRLDLAHAAEFIRSMTGLREIDAYFARREGDSFVFELVPIG